MKDLLVTGTDTGVGKTLIAAALIRALRAQRENAIGFKPAETGVEQGVPSDSEVLREASGIDEPLARPLLRLSEPLTPALAAERAGVAWRQGAVETRVQALRSAGYRVVVEGAGGVLSPLGWTWTALDLAVSLELATLVVARAGLGTLNHVLLAVEALRRRDVALLGVVLDAGSATPDLAELTNPDVLQRLLPDVTVVCVPRCETTDVIAASVEAVPHVARLLRLTMGRGLAG